MSRAVDSLRIAAIGFASLCLMAACASAPAQAMSAALSSPSAAFTPSPSVAPSNHPIATPAPVAAPANVPVGFTALPAGSYPVHLHSRCSGAQAFHITVIGTLYVSAAGSGSVSVPRSYFGRGLCLIVYSSSSLSAVLTTRRV